MLPGDLILG